MGLRCSFPIGNRSGSRFGLDVNGDDISAVVAAIRATPGLRLAGLHVHFPDHAVDSFAERARRMVAIADRLFPEGPDYLDLGGSFYGGVPAACPGGNPACSDYAAAIGAVFKAAYSDSSSPPLLILEPGTALIASAAKFVTKVITVKYLGDRCVATVAGSILNISPNTRRVDFPVAVLRKFPDVSTKVGSSVGFHVVGSTPIEDEYLSLGLAGSVCEGDFLMYGNVGAYSMTMTPLFTHPHVAVLKLGEDRTSWSVVRRAQTPEDVFRSMFCEH